MQRAATETVPEGKSEVVFWVLLALTTAAVVLVVIAPLARPAGAFPTDSGEETRVYRDQLAELDRDRERGDEYHVGDNQHQTQGGGLEKSEGHGRRAGFPASRQQEERRILRIAAPWCKSRRSGIGQPAPRV